MLLFSPQNGYESPSPQHGVAVVTSSSPEQQEQQQVQSVAEGAADQLLQIANDVPHGREVHRIKVGNINNCSACCAAVDLPGIISIAGCHGYFHCRLPWLFPFQAAMAISITGCHDYFHCRLPWLFPLQAAMTISIAGCHGYFHCRLPWLFPLQAAMTISIAGCHDYFHCRLP